MKNNPIDFFTPLPIPLNVGTRNKKVNKLKTEVFKLFVLVNVNFLGSTPLMVAVKYSSKQAVDLLLHDKVNIGQYTDFVCSTVV